MKKIYKELSVKTDKDLKRAEALKNKGWTVILWEFDYILLEK